MIKSKMRPPTLEEEQQLGKVGNLGALGYRADERQLDQGTETTEGRVEGIIAKNSPLMQQARVAGLQGMNERGLLSSTMAINAGQQSVFDKATPIAQVDAQAMQQQKLANQNASNTARQFGAGQANQLTGTQLQGTIQKDINATQNAQAEKMLGLEQNYAIERAKVTAALDTDQKTKLMAIEDVYRTKSNTNATAGNMMNQLTASLGAIMADPNMPPEQKKIQANQLIDTTYDSIRRLGTLSGVDLSAIFPAATPPAEPAPAAPAPAAVASPYAGTQPSGV